MCPRCHSRFLRIRTLTCGEQVMVFLPGNTAACIATNGVERPTVASIPGKMRGWRSTPPRGEGYDRAGGFTPSSIGQVDGFGEFICPGGFGSRCGSSLLPPTQATSGRGISRRTKHTRGCKGTRRATIVGERVPRKSDGDPETSATGYLEEFLWRDALPAALERAALSVESAALTEAENWRSARYFAQRLLETVERIGLMCVPEPSKWFPLAASANNYDQILSASKWSAKLTAR